MIFFHFFIFIHFVSYICARVCAFISVVRLPPILHVILILFLGHSTHQLENRVTEKMEEAMANKRENQNRYR